MEQRTVSLVKISPTLEIRNCFGADISQKLCHLCIIARDRHAHLYCVSSETEDGPCLKLVWKSPSKVDSCKFSEDGKRLFFVLETKSFQIHDVREALVELVAEEDTILLSALLERTGIEITETTEVKAVTFSKSQLTVLVESKWLVSLWVQYPEPLSVRSIIEISSCVAVASSREFIYSLTTGGNVAAYSVEDGKQIGLVNLYSLLPDGQGSETLEIFSDMTVSASGDVVAVSDTRGKVFVAKVQDYFNNSELQEERWNCGDSVISASSGTSYTSVRTMSSLLRIQPTGSIGDSASIYMFELTEKDKVSSYKTTWDSFLVSMKQVKSAEGLAGNDSRGIKSRGSRRSGECVSSQLLCVSEPPAGHKVQGLHMIAAGLAVWYTAVESTAGGVYRLYDMITGACLAEEVVIDDTVVIAGGCLGLMDAFLSPSCLWVFLGNLSRDVLINKLLHCVETESIGRLLRGGDWGDLVMPLPALADGLRQHQMDVARLALSLHSQAFKSSFVRNSSDSDETWHAKIHSISANTDKLFDTVYNSLLENKHKLAFSEQLILLYLDHANELLQFLHNSVGTESTTQSIILHDMVQKKKKAIMKQIMYHVVELRGHLRKHSRSNLGGSGGIYQPLGCLDDDLKKEWSKWQGLEDQEVIRDAVMGNNVPLLQTFLTTCRGWSSCNMLQTIRQEVYVWLQQLLMAQEIEKSKQILMNLGTEPYDELRDFCLKSFDKDLRDNLAAYLAERRLLKPEELQGWDMLKLIETILEARPTITHSFPVGTIPAYQRSVPTCDVPEVSESSGKLSISTVTRQSRRWRGTVLVELYFNTLDERLETLIDPELVWKYLLSNNRDDMLITWINTYYKKFDGSVGSADDSEATEMAVQRLFSLWDVTETMIDSISTVCCMSRTKEVVLEHLSRFGVFSNNEKANPCAILTRFCRTKSLNSMEQTLNQPSANVSYSDFEDLFIRFCIKHKLFNLVFPCFQNCDFSSDRINSLCLTSLEDQDEINWFGLWLTMKQLNGSLSDESVVFKAVTDATHYLSNGETDTYLREHPLVVLATTLFGKKMLKNVVQTERPMDFPISSDTLQAALHRLPLLEMALSSQQSDYRKEPDVTVYQLLQGCSPFDVSKLFGWQSLHFVKGEEFPHFSSEKLSAKYGHNVTLSYLYYLKHGRPTFAVNMFIIEQLRTHKKISRKMKKQACNFAHGLALQSFTDRRITCTCIAFIEMLGADSETVRIHVAAANKILCHLNASVINGTDKEKLHEEQVGMLMHGLIVSKERAAGEILFLLEAALQQNSPFSGDESWTVKQLLHWELAVKFARVHKMKLPEKFLKLCAIQDMWLPFILFIQLHQYPVDQVLCLVKEFRSSHLQEHLSHALSHKMAVRQETTGSKSRNKLVARDSRKVLYSAIGFRKGQPGSQDSSSESPSQTPDSATHVSSSSSEDSYKTRLTAMTTAELPSCDASKDVFFTLLNCHRSQDPPRALLAACLTLQNPLLAIFATCYEPSSVLICFCTWLVTSLDNHMSVHLKSELSSAIKQHAWSPRQVELLFEEAVSSGHVVTLARGFSIFLPENPLCAFTEFLMECVVKRNFKESFMSMKVFKAACFNMKRNPSVMDCEDMDDTFLDNGHWVASVAVNTACVALDKCFSSSYHQLLFINTLCETSFVDQLPVNVPDFSLLAQLAECLSDSGVHANWAALCRNKSCSEYQTELQHCVDQLVVVDRYQDALHFTNLVGLPKDSVVIAQWSHEFNKRDEKTHSQSETDCATFWYKCHEAFSEAGICPKSAAEFFKEHSEKVSLFKERYHVLKLALTWLREPHENEETRSDTSSTADLEDDTMEVEMWKCLLQEDTELEESLLQNLTRTNSKLLCSTKAELMKKCRLSSVATCTTLSGDQQTACLNMLIGRLLDQEDVPAACRLEAMFSHRNLDLQLLLTCMSLAEGDITPYQLSTEHRLLLSEPCTAPSTTYKRRTLQSVRLTSVSSSGVSTPASCHSPLNQSLSSEYTEVNVRDKQDTLSVLEKLVEHLHHGKKLGNRIIFCFRVAMNLDKPYQEILVLDDPLKLLRISISDDSCSKFVVASDLMLAAQMNSEEVSAFLCEEIVSAVRYHVQAETAAFSGVTLWGCDLDISFHLVLELCDDSSNLGTKLLAEATRIGATHPEANKEVVEILVRAHDCYTAALNMEGIAAILRRAQILSSNLLYRQEWALMVRLLTGVGRYTEMNYIFQMLKENEQFEFLLGKGLDKVPNLKLAVLDFLKQYCPEDRELFRLVSLHFSLFGEVADLWESEGNGRIQTLLAVMSQQGPTPNMLIHAEDTKQSLHTAMLNFTHAAEYFLRANKLTRAMSAAHQAELIALQTSLFISVPLNQEVISLLRLNGAQVSKVITQKLSFPQACIVAKAYSHPVDWGAALYHRCIIDGDTKYLTDFMYNMPLTSALVEDVARRFQLETSITQDMAKQMKKFVLGISDVEIKYRVASQLEFRDVIESLLNGSELPYLKDTVWQSGYRRQHKYF